MLPVVGGDVHYILRIWLLKKTTDEPAKMADQAVLARLAVGQNSDLASLDSEGIGSSSVPQRQLH